MPTGIKRRKTIAVITVAAIVVALALGLGLGLGLGLADRVPSVPETTVSLTAEPGYAIIFSWEASDADSYILEYEYNEYAPGTISSVQTSELSVRIDRVKGLLKYRLTAVKGDKSATGEWQYYSVPALELPQMEPFELIDSGNGVLTVDKSTLEPVVFRFKGEDRTVTNYEIGVAAPGEEGIPEVQPILLSDLESWSLYVNRSGVWKIYVRPVTYIGIGGVNAYDEELDALYSEFNPFTVISVAVTL